MTRHRPPRHGLSLVELLAGLLLLILLLAVAAPLWFQAQAKKKRLASVNNLKQWGIALNLYLMENQNRLPEAGAEFPSSADTNAWYNTLPLYLAQPALTETSAAARPPLSTTGLWTNPAAPFPRNLPTGSYVFCYAMNAWLHPDPRQPPARIYDVEAPGATLFLVETAGVLPWATAGNTAYSFGPRPPHPKAGAHVLFCDGHVELLPRSVLNHPAASDPAAPPSHPTWLPRPHCPVPSR